MYFEEMTKRDLLIFDSVGGMRLAKVHKAINMKTGQKIAVKMYKDIDKESALWEIDANEHLQHKNIIKYHGWFKDGGMYYILFDLAPMGDVWNYLQSKDESMTEEETKSILSSILNAVSHIHSKKWIHRDIKPENVLIFKDLKGKLCDLEFALDTKRGEPEHRVGTLEYMSPEMLMSGMKIRMGYSNETDIWSIGILAFECLHKKTPFIGNTHEDMLSDIVQKIIGNEIVFDSHISHNARDFIMGCLQWEPGRRTPITNLIQHEWFLKCAPCCF